VFVGLLFDWFEAEMNYDLMDFAVSACRLIFKADWKDLRSLFGPGVSETNKNK
jgi:hypothetical protein